MTNSANKKLKELKGANRRAFQSIGDDIAKHRWRYAAIAVMHGWLLGLYFTTAMGTLLSFGVAVIETVLLLFTARLLLAAARMPGRTVHEWALAENEELTVASLQGKTTDELERMLQYHLTNGHMDAADRISQQLLLMVDGLPSEAPVFSGNTAGNAPASAVSGCSAPGIAGAAPSLTSVPHVAAATVAAGDDGGGTVIKIPTGLPGWMQENPSAEEEKTAQAVSLPDWMKN